MAKKKWIKILTISCLGVLLIMIAGIYFFSELLPSLPEAPLARVVALPKNHQTESNRKPYLGPHPSTLSRPEETFSFPIALGEIGPVEPLFAGENQYPFFCGIDYSRGDSAQPLVDNHQGIGIPIFGRDENGGLDMDDIVGYSKDCSYPTRVEYYYNRVGTNNFYPLDQAEDDIAKIVVDGRKIDFVVRLETGTINRFIYAIAALKGEGEDLAHPRETYWNQRLVFQFRGGVGIGKRQGKFSANSLLSRRIDVLKQGYAVAYSTANQTSNHYNIWLAEDSALRVKRQFTSQYGEPLYTVGVGGSGGAIQQYLLAQNNPDILDAAIPLYSYPDMVSQTIYVMDCEPLEYFFDVTDADNPLWSNWENRSWIEGVNADANAENNYQIVNTLAAMMRGDFASIGNSQEGATECVKGWRGLTPLVHNPKFVHFMSSYAPAVAQHVHWTHWDDLKSFYGVDEYGFANSTWDNIGVQYGLEALRNGQISASTFLKLNAQVGGWKPAREMREERLWILGGEWLPVNLSFWSHQNMRLSQGKEAAPRTQGSLEAINGAYHSGHIFIGLADIPIIDLRHYLDGELNMHHATASFAARVRMQRGQGHADNQIIWMSDKKYNPVGEAFAVIDRWMLNILAHPERSVVENKPLQAEDKCFADDGSIIAQGKTVWDGPWNHQPTGACMVIYPRHKTSREIAGGDVAGDVFKCALQSVEQAIDKGVYGDVDMRPYKQRLESLFPAGVCDFSLGDIGRPKDLLKVSRLAATGGDATGGEKPSKPVVPEIASDGKASGDGEVQQPVTLSRMAVEASEPQ